MNIIIKYLNRTYMNIIFNQDEINTTKKLYENIVNGKVILFITPIGYDNSHVMKTTIILLSSRYTTSVYLEVNI